MIEFGFSDKVHHSRVTYEILPGLLTFIDETCCHPLKGGSALGDGPDRPCRPCSDDYCSSKEPVTPRPLDRSLPFDTRLKSGFWRMA